MAKIIYGVSGHGFGHSTRSRELLKHLTNQGHKVLVFTYDQGLFFLDKEFDVFEIPGLTLIYKKKKLVYWGTAIKNTKRIIHQTRYWKKISKTFKDFNPDLVITDFEPLTAILAKVHRRPLISIDNQHQLTNTKIKVPFGYLKHLWFSRFIIRSVVRKANYYLITSFFKTPITKKNTSIFPPILRHEIAQLTPKKKNYFLVYQTTNIDDIIKELKKINEKFIVFGSSRSGQEDNIEFKDYDFKDWLQCLADCRGIIGTAGSSLISESLHLKKPYLAIPLRKQTEQIINAQYLEAMGYGISSTIFNEKVFNKFRNKMPELETNLMGYEKEGNEAIYRKLDEIIKSLN